MPTNREILTATYNAFNTRDIEATLAVLHPDVEWPNGWEGGYISGREAVRAYWTRQWAAIDPHVEPQVFSDEADGNIDVTVHQVVRDLSGGLLSDSIVHHVYTLEDGLVRRMEIRD